MDRIHYASVHLALDRKGLHQVGGAPNASNDLVSCVRSPARPCGFGEPGHAGIGRRQSGASRHPCGRRLRHRLSSRPLRRLPAEPRPAWPGSLLARTRLALLSRLLARSRRSRALPLTRVNVRTSRGRRKAAFSSYGLKQVRCGLSRIMKAADTMPSRGGWRVRSSRAQKRSARPDHRITASFPAQALRPDGGPPSAGEPECRR